MFSLSFYYCDLVSALNIMESELKYDLEKTVLTRRAVFSARERIMYFVLFIL